MVGDLEYLMTSLPFLILSGGSEMRSDVYTCLKKYAGSANEHLDLADILDLEAKKFLSPQKYSLFQSIKLSRLHEADFRESDLPLLAEFAHFMWELRHQLKEIRVARRSETDEALLARIPSPVKPGNPLEEELDLIRLQWDKLDRLAEGAYASFTALVAYKIKLLLLVRYWSFDTEKGYEVFVESTNA